MNDDLKSKVLALNKIIDYQEGTIVSKTIINKQTGTITLFAFDEGQGLSEHSAPFDATVTVLDGEAEITITGEKFHLNAGEMIIMPANDPHAVRAIKQFKMMLTMIK